MGMDFAPHLRELLQQRNVSLRALARQIPIDPGQLSRVLNGKRLPTEDFARRCDAIFGTGDLLTRSAQKSRASSPQRPRPTLTTSSPLTRVWNIIPPVRGFLGRDSEINRIEQSLRGQNADGLDLGAVGVHGIPGVGKTQLALAFADQHKGRYRLGWWVSAETSLDITTGLSRLSVRLGASEDWSSAELLHFLAEELRSQEPWLIIFDNASLPADIEPFIPPAGSGQGHILFTSRNPSWRLLAEPVAVGVLGIADATNLLSDRSHDTDYAAAEALAHELGQLPLAISQAAAYAADTNITFTEYLGLFRQERARLLDRGLAMAYPGVSSQAPV